MPENRPRRILKSCGILCFRDGAGTEFLLLRHPHRYDLPKGHIEDGEEELECALRELDEETGISARQVEILDGFRFATTYYPKYRRFGGERVDKTVVVFLGRVAADVEITPTEHRGYRWVPADEELEASKKNLDAVLQAAREFLAGRGNESR